MVSVGGCTDYYLEMENNKNNIIIIIINANSNRLHFNLFFYSPISSSFVEHENEPQKKGLEMKTKNVNSITATYRFPE